MTNSSSPDFILSFGRHGCDGLSQTWHRILSGLAESHTVMHVLPHFHIRSDTPLHQKRRLSGLRRLKANLYEYQPPWFLESNHRYPSLDRAIKSLGISAIRRTAGGLGCREPVVYIWHPVFADMVGKFRQKLTCYHVYDDYFGYRGGDPAELSALHSWDEQLLTKSDLIFAASRSLLRRLRESRPDAMLVPNGADYEAFASASQDDVRIPPDIAAIPRPRIGYTGNINVKVDFDLVEYLAQQRPRWSIVMVGPLNAVGNTINRCLHLKNVHFLGERPYDHIPHYVAALDACIMPYLLEGWVISGYPLKLHEYLAAGKPVVSADLESTREYADVIDIASAPEEWLHLVERALAGDSAELAVRRRGVARCNTWKQRVTLVESSIEAALEEYSAPMRARAG